MEDDLEIRIGRFFTDTRMRKCLAMHCRFNDRSLCNLKEISLDRDAGCRSFERRSARRDENEEKLEMEKEVAGERAILLT